MVYKISRTKEYQEWLQEETFKSQAQIRKRLSNIEIEGHFGDHKHVGVMFGSLDGKMDAVFIMRRLRILMCCYC